MDASDAFYNIDPIDILLVIHNGKIRLYDERLKDQLLNNKYDISGFSKVIIGENSKYVYGDLPFLIKKIHEFYPEALFPVKIVS